MKLQMEHLTMTYPTGKKALQDMSLTLSSPQMIGLLGPNGSGKVHPDEASDGRRCFPPREAFLWTRGPWPKAKGP